MKLGIDRLLLKKRLTDIGLICAVGLVIAWIVGFLQNPTPIGDDASYYVGMIKMLGENFPLVAWDPHVFAGYVPTIGISWLTYFVPLTLVRVGLSDVAAFHFAFVCVFLLFGFALYFFARSVGCDRVASFSMTVLGWSTNAYWNNAIWGGAYNRLFTIPFLFLALGTTVRYLSRLHSGTFRGRDYWICLAAWTLTYLGDIFIAIAATMVGLVFVLLSAGIRDAVVGAKRTLTMFLPAIALASWQLVPILLQDLAVGAYRIQYTVPESLSLLIVPDSKWTSTLNFVYIPLVLLFGILFLLVRPRTTRIEQSLLVSLFLAGAYWLVMGWIPLLWPILPRLMATNSSVENLAWVLLAALPLTYSILQRDIVASRRFQFHFRWISGTLPRTPRLWRIASVLMLGFIVADAAIVLPSITPVDWTSLSDHLNAGINASLGASSNDYRVALENRPLTRGFSYYQPFRFQTGGRVANLDPNPFFDNWYSTDIFYKNDLQSIGFNYFEDNPAVNVSSLLEAPYNFAGSQFWLDWYASNAVVFYPYSYLHFTIGNYTTRSSMFSATSWPTGYPANEFVVKPSVSGAVLEATNATVVGFYSASTNSLEEYHSLISILSELGLSSRFVIPLYFTNFQDIRRSPVQLLVTDSYTYLQDSALIQPLFNTCNVVVVSSVEGQAGNAATVTPEGSKARVDLPLSFTQLVSSQEDGAYYFAKSVSLVPITLVNPQNSLYTPGSAFDLNSNSWVPQYKTPNAIGTLQSVATTVTLNITNTDPSNRAQFNIRSILPSIVPLSDGLTLGFSIHANENVTIGASFDSSNSSSPNYVSIDQNITGGSYEQFQIPISKFSKWQNSTAMFGISRDLVFAVNLNHGYSGAIVTISNVTVTFPSYTIYKFATPLTFPGESVILHDVTVAGIGLMNGSNSSTPILNLSRYAIRTIVTMDSFEGEQTGSQYDQIITVGGGTVTPPSVSIFTPSASTPVHEEWINNQQMIAESIPSGFRGLVWKETYDQLWRFDVRTNSSSSNLTYYYAGPGMFYIPMESYTPSISATFQSINYQSATLASVTIATVGLLATSRKRIPFLGRKKRVNEV